MFVFLRWDIFYEHAVLFLRIKFLWTKIRKQSWLFWKENLPAECSFEHKKCNFNNAVKKLDKNSKNFRSVFENNYINKRFSQKTISWENVSSHVGCWPGSLAEKISPEIWKVSGSKKSGRKIVYWDSFFLKMFPRRRRKQKRHSC